LEAPVVDVTAAAAMKLPVLALAPRMYPVEMLSGNSDVG
jgi:hypothetical protein